MQLQRETSAKRDQIWNQFVWQVKVMKSTKHPKTPKIHLLLNQTKKPTDHHPHIVHKFVSYFIEQILLHLFVLSWQQTQQLFSVGGKRWERESKQMQNNKHSRLTHNGIIAGKLKEQIPAQTPRGSLMLYVSIPFGIFEANSPICKPAIPQACSNTSKR